MKFNWLFRSIGIVLKSEIQNLVLLLKKEYGILPSSQNWNDTKVQNSARNLLKKHEFYHAKSMLIDEIKLHPYNYINGWSKSMALNLYEGLDLFYSKEMGDDFTLIKELCINHFIELIESGIDSAQVLKQIIDDIKREPNVYVKVNKNGAIQLAKMIFEQFKNDLTNALPNGFRIIDLAIINEIADLIVERVPMESLIELLLKMIQANPMKYLISPPPRHHGPVDYAQRS
jgi:hypothetical protein